MEIKLFILASLCMIVLHADAQTEKGREFIGGAISFRSENHTDYGNSVKSKTFQINPNYGHFFRSNLAIGVALNYTYTNQEVSYDVLTGNGGNYFPTSINATLKQNAYGIGPFIRYYFDITEKFKYYGQFNAVYGYGKTNNSSSIVSYNSYHSHSVSIFPGLAIFPTKKLAIELGFELVSYTKVKRNYNEIPHYAEAESEYFNFGFNSFSPSIGINFHW